MAYLLTKSCNSVALKSIASLCIKMTKITWRTDDGHVHNIIGLNLTNQGDFLLECEHSSVLRLRSGSIEMQSFLRHIFLNYWNRDTEDIPSELEELLQESVAPYDDRLQGEKLEE